MEYQFTKSSHLYASLSDWLRQSLRHLLLMEPLDSLSFACTIKSSDDLRHLFHLVEQERGRDFALGAEIGFAHYRTPWQENLSMDTIQILNHSLQITDPKPKPSANRRWAGKEYGEMLAEALREVSPLLLLDLQPKFRMGQPILE